VYSEALTFDLGDKQDGLECLLKVQQSSENVISEAVNLIEEDKQNLGGAVGKIYTYMSSEGINFYFRG